jgi:uncharacterized oxidoreductase
VPIKNYQGEIFMNITGNTILITGGSSGIGLALAQRFVQNGNTVIVCGRDTNKLESVTTICPELHIKCCDVADAEQRSDLFEWTAQNFPSLNVLFNNAGVQQIIDYSSEVADWQSIRKEIAVNLEAPIHLAQLFIPHLSAQNNSVIVNVTSGLAFMPPIWAPLYGATKAGLHSYTFVLREQLKKIGIEVVEIIPPKVNTDLGGNGSNRFGMDVGQYADKVLMGLKNGDAEIMGADTAQLSELSRYEVERHAKRH